jgi:hypothetical protein
MILARKKTWEFRGKKTNVRGTIALIRGGSGLIVDTCELVDVVGPLTLNERSIGSTDRTVSSKEFLGKPFVIVLTCVHEERMDFRGACPSREVAVRF